MAGKNPDRPASSAGGVRGRNPTVGKSVRNLQYSDGKTHFFKVLFWE